MPIPHPNLRIDTTDLVVEDDPAPPPPDTRFSARLVNPGGRERGISFSRNVLPSLRISTAGDQEKHTASHNIATVVATQGTDRAKNESRKLLSHLLEQLQGRDIPSSTDGGNGQNRTGGIRIGSVVKSVKKVVTSKDSNEGRRMSMNTSDDEDDEMQSEVADFYTDATFDLMSQLKDVFLVASAQGWNLFSDRPMRPPNALQAVTLDVAQYLIHSHRDNPEVISRVGFAMIYAFHTFRPSMHARLLAFFDESVLGGMLERLSRVQKRADSLPTAPDTSFEDPTTASPPVAIMVDGADDDVRSPTAQGQWNRWSSPRAPLEKASLSTNAPDQNPAVYYLSALLPPLLAAVVEKVDFFSTNLPTIYRLHLFLDRLVTRKPDIYLDLLAVVAYHPPSSRYTALSLLTNFCYVETVAKMAERGQTVIRQPLNHDQHHPYAHQFTPWRFRSDDGPLLYEGATRNECRAELVQKSYEEIAIIDSVLWTQLQILNNGIALGSIVVHSDNTPTGHGELAEFELHYVVTTCEALLASKTLAVSEALSDYQAENRASSDEYLMYFDLNNLVYVASVLKLPPVSKMGPSGSSDLLSAAHPQQMDDTDADSQHPFEIVPLAHVRDQLGDGFGITSDAVARHYLSHLHHLGFLQPTTQGEELFDGNQDPKERLCCFPLPLGFDVSADIETLVAAIEACLQDLDLSINEVGFLLLTRRFWPDGMLSEYTFRRLTKAILLWIFSEDDNLATILRDYVARSRTLPGVWVGVDNQPWPSTNRSRPIAANSASNGGDYVATRRALAERYVVPWLLALHDKDINAYAVLVYDLTAEHAEAGYTDDYDLLGIPATEYQASDHIV
ncbi:hypothetical protein EIP91_000012 [Steccherinum ochraceum]|uniref:Uncharacterized protein n=1 Tax=Steccherinum ochraceum TaxID=92696 RepID=A0A4R0RSF3_9APHY|nr:hypothetical protein EIP91_000012 [Steccherinum ochraceum]